MEILGFWTPSGIELVVIAIIALLLFGKRLPEVARGLGKGVVEFKKGLKGVEDEMDDVEYQAPKKHLYTDEKSKADAKETHPDLLP
jgi:sec-independent protein translocase protein TatA